MIYDNFIDQILKKHFSEDVKFKSKSSVSGGCINSAFKISTSSAVFFLKWNDESLKEMFASEARGLLILHQNSGLKIPKPLGKGMLDGKSYLLTEWIEKGVPAVDFWKSFGTGLADQHRKSDLQFGLDHNNFIGSLRQSNTKHNSWHDFFVNERLLPQIKLASAKGLISSELSKQFDSLFDKLEKLVPEEPPALLHGDLWSGNFMIYESGKAAIFDPAVHYGHRETELAFTTLFGGFSPEFYKYYNESYPLEKGFEERIDIHNLYPLLVHVNLFGTSYLNGIKQTLKRYS